MVEAIEQVLAAEVLYDNKIFSYPIFIFYSLQSNFNVQVRYTPCTVLHLHKHIPNYCIGMEGEAVLEVSKLYYKNVVLMIDQYTT